MSKSELSVQWDDFVIIGITGMPYSGKSVFVSVAKGMGIPSFLMRSVVEEEMRKKGMPVDNVSLREYSTKIRMEFGRGVVAERCIPYLDGLLKEHKAVLLDSIRSPEEVEALRKVYRDFVVVAINASPNARFSRLGKKRPGHKSDEPRTVEELEWRDKKELSWGLGDVIAHADIILENEGSEQEFRKKAGELIEGILKRRA